MANTLRTHRLMGAGIIALLLCSAWLVPPAAGDSSFTTIEWFDLIPAKDLEALQNPPSYITEIEEGSLEDQANELRNATDASADDAYQRALVSTNANPDLNGQRIRIPGFVVPLEFNDDLNVTQFLLVPYFGACIHVPAPPPNQIILVNSPEGFKLDSMYEPFWVSGMVQVSITENDLATTAYTLDLQAFEAYE